MMARFRKTIITTAVILLTATAAFSADWPQYRFDATRSGHTTDPLPQNLSLQWTREARCAPHRAWVGNVQAESRMKFDWSYSVVAADGRLFYGSSTDHQVHALDAATGESLWSTFTEGPVRLAPAVYEGRVYAVSDDGRLYCLDAKDGRELWRVEPKDEIDRMVGNGRIVSRWAARGGPAIRDGIVYYGAGVWALEGVTIFAVDARTGDIIWANDDSGYLNIEHPHMGAMSEGGVIAQGYLAITKDKVFVAAGRATPAAFDRKTGEFLYFHLSRFGGKTPKGLGGGDVVVTNEVFFNSGAVFDTETGMRHSSIGTGKWWEPVRLYDYDAGWLGEGQLGANRIVCPVGSSFVRSEGATIYSSILGRKTYIQKREAESYFFTSRVDSMTPGDPNARRIRVEPKSRQEEIADAPTLKDAWEIDTKVEGNIWSLIVAGNTIVAGGDGVVAAFNARTKEELLREKVDGSVLALAAADGRLYASTDTGAIYCFGAGGEKPRDIAPRETTVPFNNGSPAAKRAQFRLERTRIRKGYAVVPDCGDGELAYHVARLSDLYVIALSTNQKALDAARRNLDAAGVYGVRVQAMLRSETKTWLPDYFANLIFVDEEPYGAPVYDDLLRILRPSGGTICWADPDLDSLTSYLTRDAIKGGGDWSHPLGDAGNSLCSGDEVVRGPLGLLWYEDETLIRIDRHGKNPSPLYHRGVLIQIGRDELRAIDAYNGTSLWRQPMPGVLAGMTGGTGVGATASGATYCVVDGVVFVRIDRRCERFDVFSGKRLESFNAPKIDGVDTEWSCLAVDDGVLIGALANPAQVVKSQHGNGNERNQLPMEEMYVESLALFGLDARTGKTLWTRKAKDSIRNNSIALGGGRLFFIDRPVAEIDTILKDVVNARLRGKEPVPAHPTGKLIALDAKTGDVAWSDDDNIFGTTMCYSDEYDALVMSFNNVGRAMPSDITTKGARAYRSSSGERLWDNEFANVGRSAIIGRTLYSYDSIDLLTGKARKDENGANWRMKGSGIGCGVWVGADHLMLRRSGTLGYYDLDRDSGWIDNYGAMRTGCWINALPVGGIVVAPDDTQGCRCSYQNQASVALIQRGVRAPDVGPAKGETFQQRTSVGREVVFVETLKIAITHDQSGEYELRYTTDGSFARADSPLYKGPINLTRTTAIGATLFKDGKKVAVRDPVIFLKITPEEYETFTEKTKKGNSPD